jgi:FKBP-type peptidyl-prolyl cis-trans isomerase FklB
MLIRTAFIALPLLALPVAAMAQPAVPAVPPAPAAQRPATAPVAAPRPAAAAPAPSADDPPTTSAAAAPAFAPAPAARAAAAPAPAASADTPPTTAAVAAPVAPAAADDAPTSDAAPTTLASAAPAAPAVPTAESIQTVTKASPLTVEGNAQFLVTYAAMPGVKTLPNGVMYRVLVEGKSKNTPLGRLDLVTVSYRGWLINGTSFDNSQPGNPRTFQIAQLIEGWREAMLKMKEGDLWEVVIPAALAYGAEGRAGVIPPNQTLVFVISLAKIEYAG